MNQHWSHNVCWQTVQPLHKNIQSSLTTKLCGTNFLPVPSDVFNCSTSLSKNNPALFKFLTAQYLRPENLSHHTRRESQKPRFIQSHFNKALAVDVSFQMLGSLMLFYIYLIESFYKAKGLQLHMSLLTIQLNNSWYSYV